MSQGVAIIKPLRFAIRSRRFACLILVLGTVVIGGCGDARRQGVEGMVTFDGQPIVKGYIQFIPEGDTRGPTAGANIKDGRFAIDPSKGTFVGTFRVEVLATRETGKSIADPMTGEKVAAREQYIPAKYNTQSELTAEIKDGQPSQLNYPLTSK